MGYGKEEGGRVDVHPPTRANPSSDKAMPVSEYQLEQVVRRLDDHGGRLRTVEQQQEELRTSRAVDAERQRHMDKRFDRLETSLHESFTSIKRVFFWALGTFAGAFLLAAARWVIGGGLS